MYDLLQIFFRIVKENSRLIIKIRHKHSYTLLISNLQYFSSFEVKSNRV